MTSSDAHEAHAQNEPAPPRRRGRRDVLGMGREASRGAGGRCTEHARDLPDEGRGEFRAREGENRCGARSACRDPDGDHLWNEGPSFAEGDESDDKGQDAGTRRHGKTNGPAESKKGMDDKQGRQQRRVSRRPLIPSGPKPNLPLSLRASFETSMKPK